MGTNAVQRGPAAEAVAHNVRAIRERRKMSQAELAKRVTELGRPMQTTAVAKVEAGERRVDVDDLVLLSAALNVSLGRLLVQDVEAHELVSLLPGKGLEAESAWGWASGDGPLGGGGGGGVGGLAETTTRFGEFMMERPAWLRARDDNPLIQAERAVARAVAQIVMATPSKGDDKARALPVKQARAKWAALDALLEEYELGGTSNG